MVYFVAPIDAINDGFLVLGLTDENKKLGEKMIEVVAGVIYNLLEHEDYKWITKDDKDNFEFAGADVKVFDLI